ncbi:Signal transduction histidine-protein kinase/phosphatase MprB OS=Streptomyces antimycoticus OX=68175 GN=SANT12839_038530 PE=4 SV=1 [Streptomyces antimycoticus]
MLGGTEVRVWLSLNGAGSADPGQRRRGRKRKSRGRTRPKEPAEH